MERPRKPHMTNQDLATKLGLNHSTVSKYRSGQRTPSFTTMFVIEEALDWSLEHQILALMEGVYAPYLEGQIARLADGQTPN